MTDAAAPICAPARPSLAPDLCARLERRLMREVEAFEQLAPGRSDVTIEAFARIAKRLADAARSLVALQTALVRLAQVAAGRSARRPAPASTQDAPAKAGPIEPAPANRAERRRLERLTAKATRSLERLNV